MGFDLFFWQWMLKGQNLYGDYYIVYGKHFSIWDNGLRRFKMTSIMFIMVGEVDLLVNVRILCRKLMKTIQCLFTICKTFSSLSYSYFKYAQTRSGNINESFRINSACYYSKEVLSALLPTKWQL